MGNIASRKIAGGVIVQQICGSCRHAFWSGCNDHKTHCADCDPNLLQHDNYGIGRNLDRKRSDSAYHGGGYAN